MPEAIEAFIFDFGNVLSLPPHPLHFESMAKLLDAEIARFESAYFHWRNNYDDDTFDQHKYWSEVAKLLGKKIEAHHSKQLFDMDFKMWFREPNAITVNWVKHLKANGYKVGLLSNMPRDHKEHLDANCSWFPKFDHRTFSGELQIAKPKHDIYMHCLNGLKAKPEQTIFIDDNIDNIKAANTLGLNAIHFVNAEQAAQEIRSKHNIELPTNS